VRHKSHFNRKKGRMEGIEITEVAPGSIAAQHGVKSGDVIVSVNGTPVNSVQEAISYAKNNADIYSVWTIVVSNAGYERTIVYETE
jgi:S1-C subfamily serine protease